jgi:hypothetical protein
VSATNTDIVVEQGADFSQDFTIADTSGRTYTVTRFDLDWQTVTPTFTATVSDGTTVAMTMSDTNTDGFSVPPGFSWRDYAGQCGWYTMEETVTATEVVSRVYYGKITLHRKR